VASLDLPADRSAPARARRFLRETLSAWGLDGDLVEDGELLVSELVTNAVLHARSPSSVQLERRGSHLWVAVRDESAMTPRIRDYGPEAVTGRGLLLVDRIAQRWGVEHDSGGKYVWFEIELSNGPVEVGTARA
jgi:anti-sigma regulatory factor (Ser/Thr protein kinase)